MRVEFSKNINIYGSKKDTDYAISQLDIIKDKLTNDESLDRVLLQLFMDDRKIKADILYKGNTVWSKKRIIRDLKRALKSKPSIITENGNGDYTLTNYLYQFLTLCCGSIAHYNKYGWIGTYPTKDEFKRFFRANEFGVSVVNHQPTWKTDCINIAQEILTIV